jgi:hypothetical protein
VTPLLDQAARRIQRPDHAQSVTLLVDRGHPRIRVSAGSAALTRIFVRFRISPRILLTRWAPSC